MKYLLRFNEGIQDQNSLINTVDFYINLYKDDFDLYKINFSDSSWEPDGSIYYFVKVYVGGTFATQKGYINEDIVLFFQFVSSNIVQMKKLLKQVKILPKILKEDEGIFSTVNDFNYDEDSEYYITLKVYLSEKDYHSNTIETYNESY